MSGHRRCMASQTSESSKLGEPPGKLRDFLPNLVRVRQRPIIARSKSVRGSFPFPVFRQKNLTLDEDQLQTRFGSESFRRTGDRQNNPIYVQMDRTKILDIDNCSRWLQPRPQSRLSRSASEALRSDEQLQAHLRAFVVIDFPFSRSAPLQLRCLSFHSYLLRGPGCLVRSGRFNISSESG